MGIYQFKPPMSGRMGTLWTLASIRGAALVEYGCMGHMLYGRVFLNKAGIADGCRLYSTHIDETDISLGDTGRLDRALAEIIRQDQPKAVFLLPSAVPTVIGTDLTALCRELQPLYPEVLLLPFGSGGFDVDGNRGVEEALLLLAKTFPRRRDKTSQPTFNLIGSCADLFRFHADALEVIRLMEGAFGMKPLCIMTSDTSVDELEEMGGAHVNIVLRREGERAAGHLQQRFGTPYMTGRPYGISGTSRWLEEVGGVIEKTPDAAFVQKEVEKARKQLLPSLRVFQHMLRSHPGEAVLSVGGHADVVRGIRDYGCGELLLPEGDFWCNCPGMGSEEIPYFSEEQWSKAITARPKGLLMASGEALAWADRNRELQIANPDIKWRLSQYEPPFVGFHGAVHLAGLWLNAILEQDD